MKFLFLLCFCVGAFGDDVSQTANLDASEQTTESAVATSSESTSVTHSDPSIDTTTAKSNVSCEVWPSSLKPLRECCEIPDHVSIYAQSSCQSKCSMTEKNLRDTCIINCYVRQTGLLKHESVDKATVKKMYETNSYDSNWRKIINASVDKCEFVSNASLTENLALFFNCVEDLMAESCVRFIESEECDKVQDHFEKCRNVHPNCTEWPIGLLQPSGCCKFPILFAECSSKCKQSCQKKEIFAQKRLDCEHNCTISASELITVNRSLDFAIAKKMLIENSNNSEEWKKPIDHAVESCEKIFKG